MTYLAAGIITMLVQSTSDPQTQRVDSIARAAARSAFEYQEAVATSTRRRIADSTYVASLEQSVRRSALDGTWMGVYVGALGGLFAIGAIAAGYMLYRQSRDYQRRLTGTLRKFESAANAVFADYKAILDTFIADRNAESAQARQVAEARIEQLIKDSQTEVGAARQKIDDEITKVRGQLDALQPIASPQPLSIQVTEAAIPWYNLGSGGTTVFWPQVGDTNTGRIILGADARAVPIAKRKNQFVNVSIRLGDRELTCTNCGALCLLPAGSDDYMCPKCNADLPN